MPALQMLSMCLQVCAGQEELIVVFQVEVMGLQVHQDKDSGHSSRELAKGIVGILRLQGHALTEFFIMHLRTAAHFAAVLPRSRSAGMERTSRTKLALTEGIHRRPHRGIVWRTEALKDTLQPCGIGHCPALVCVVTEAQARYIRIAAGT